MESPQYSRFAITKICCDEMAKKYDGIGKTLQLHLIPSALLTPCLTFAWDRLTLFRGVVMPQLCSLYTVILKSIRGLDEAIGGTMWGHSFVPRCNQNHETIKLLIEIKVLINPLRTKFFFRRFLGYNLR